MTDKALIKFVIANSNRIEYTMQMTGETGIIPVVGNKLRLQLGRMYKVAVNTKENLDDHNVLKLIGGLKLNVDVREIKDGFAYVYPLIQNITITNDTEIGYFI